MKKKKKVVKPFEDTLQDKELAQQLRECRIIFGNAFVDNIGKRFQNKNNQNE